jgi:hypothetical protein
MGKIDPEQERVRLAARYATMSDLELQKVGRDPWQLTDWGRDALISEIKKRGLPWSPDPLRAKPILEDEILVSLATYADDYQARIGRDMLANVGVKAFFCVGDPTVADDNPAIKNEVRLLVRARDVPVARQQLKTREQAERDVEEHFSKDGKGDRPVIIRRYRDISQAIGDKSALEASGILCFLQDDNVIRMDWFWSNAIGGIKLLVRETDAEDAETILSQQASDDSIAMT